MASNTTDLHPESNAEKLSKQAVLRAKYYLTSAHLVGGSRCTDDGKTPKPDRAIRGCSNNVCIKDNKRHQIYSNACHMLMMYQEWLEILHT